MRVLNRPCWSKKEGLFMAIKTKNDNNDILYVLQDLKSNISADKVLELFNDKFDELESQSKRLQFMIKISPQIKETILSGDTVFNDRNNRIHLIDALHLRFSVGMSPTLTRDDASPLFTLDVTLTNNGTPNTLEKKFWIYLVGDLSRETLAKEIAASLKRKISTISRQISLNKIKADSILDGSLSGHLFSSEQLVKIFRTKKSFVSVIKLKTKKQLECLIPNIEYILEMSLKRRLDNNDGDDSNTEISLWQLLSLFNKDKAESLFAKRLESVPYMSVNDINYHLLLIKQLLGIYLQQDGFYIDTNLVKTVIESIVPNFNNTKVKYKIHFNSSAYAYIKVQRDLEMMYNRICSICELCKFQLPSLQATKLKRYNITQIKPTARIITNVKEYEMPDELVFGKTYLPNVRRAFKLSTKERLMGELEILRQSEAPRITTPQYATSLLTWFEIMTNANFDVHHYLVVIKNWKSDEYSELLKKRVYQMYDDLHLQLLKNWEEYSKTIENPILLNEDKLAATIERFKSEFSLYMGNDESYEVEVCPFITYNP